jgi:hypothetical protein
LDANDLLTQITTNRRRLPYFATVRGRFSILVNPQTLLVGTGGGALEVLRLSSQAADVPAVRRFRRNRSARPWNDPQIWHSTAPAVYKGLPLIG